MGICASCLGQQRRDSSDEPNETSRLLHHNPYDQQYGNGYPDSASNQPDPEAVKRAQDALLKICAQTLDKLIDVSQTSVVDQRSMADYARLFAEAFPPSSSGPTIDDEQAWVRHVIQNAPKDADRDWTSVQPVEGALISSLDPQDRAFGKE